MKFVPSLLVPSIKVEHWKMQDVFTGKYGPPHSVGKDGTFRWVTTDGEFRMDKTGARLQSEKYTNYLKQLKDRMESNQQKLIDFP